MDGYVDEPVEGRDGSAVCSPAGAFNIHPNIYIDRIVLVNVLHVYDWDMYFHILLLDNPLNLLFCV